MNLTRYEQLSTELHEMLEGSASFIPASFQVHSPESHAGATGRMQMLTLTTGTDTSILAARRISWICLHMRESLP